MKYFIEESTLTGIGDAIREKNGTSDLIPVTGLADAIINLPSGGGDIPEEVLVITGDCSYRFSNNGWNAFIDAFGNQITTKDVGSISNMCYNSYSLTRMPFVINGKGGNNVANASYAFYGCSALTEAPVLKNINISQMDNMYYGCTKLRYIPEPDDSVTFTSAITNSTSRSCDSAFYNCYSLRRIPDKYLATIRNAATSSNRIAYYNTFYNCVALDELKGLGVCQPYAWTSNMLTPLGSQLARINAFTFATQDDGTPYVASWKSQTLNLQGIGYVQTSLKNYLLNYNSGITTDKEVTDEATYQALKVDPDWWTTDFNYSRYNHNSAVETINSLPDTSAYLTANGGTNTIQFRSAMGANTDGGAISNLTEEEIAVATAKGWTVTLA